MVKKYVYTGPIKHYCACCGKLLKTEWSGWHESDLSSVMQVDSDGFAIVRDRLCGECQYEENAVAIKKSGKVFKFLAFAAIVILLITGIVLAAGYLLNNAVFGNSDLLKKSFAKKLDQFEKDERKKVYNDGCETVAAAIKECFSANDYTIYYYGENGKVEITKYTLANTTLYSLRFDKDYGKYANKTYVIKDNVIYENGDEKFAYHATSEGYSDLKATLEAYLPEHSFKTDIFSSRASISDEKNVIADVLYSSSTTVYCNYDESKFYFKSSNEFYYASFDEAGKGKAVSFPKESEYSVK